MPDELIWQGETEHHFAVVAFDHMLEALKLSPDQVPIPTLVEEEVAEVRDLVTHWRDNMPVFNTHPQSQAPPRKTGRSYATRNPGKTPYSWFSWTSRRGAMLTTNVSATDARAAIRTVQDAVLAEDAYLARFVPSEVESPWFVDEQGSWWPAQSADTQ